MPPKQIKALKQLKQSKHEKHQKIRPQGPSDFFWARKHIPVGYDIFYMAGENNDVPVYITPNNSLLPVLETQQGKIVAIIDKDDYIRVMHRYDHLVQVDQCNRNHVQVLTRKDIMQARIHYDIKYKRG